MAILVFRRVYIFCLYELFITVLLNDVRMFINDRLIVVKSQRIIIIIYKLKIECYCLLAILFLSLDFFKIK